MVSPLDWYGEAHLAEDLFWTALRLLRRFWDLWFLIGNCCRLSLRLSNSWLLLSYWLMNNWLLLSSSRLLLNYWLLLYSWRRLLPDWLLLLLELRLTQRLLRLRDPTRMSLSLRSTELRRLLLL